MPADPRALTPLTDLQIVSLAVNLPGPVAAARLRDLGATVVKIEPPDGDPLARGCAAWYQALHENVSVVRLDLKEPVDRRRLDELLGESDLLLTSSRPAALERLGLGRNTLQAQFPRLCHVAIVGHSHPDENKPGHDLTYQASLGLVDPPHLPRALLADLGGAEEAVTSAVSLLLARERGHGARMAEVDLRRVRLDAESVENDLYAARPPLHGNAARVMFLAARRYDALARKFQIASEVRAMYADAVAHANDGSGTTLRDLFWSRYWLWELRDAYEELAPLYADAWRYESREGHLASNLERYHLAAQRAIRLADAIYRATYDGYVRSKTLPPFDTVIAP